MIRLKKPIKNLKNKALVLDRNVPIANFAKEMDDHRRRFISHSKTSAQWQVMSWREPKIEWKNCMQWCGPSCCKSEIECGVFNSSLALLRTEWPNLSPLSFFVPEEWWKRYRNDCCSMRNEWRYGFQGKAFCNIGKTCKDSRCNPSATQELGYTGETLTLHWKKCAIWCV